MAVKIESSASSLPKVQRERSPAYPFISLKVAIERVQAFEAKFGRHGSPMDKAGLAWDYKPNSSQAAQTLSALKYFGLVEYNGPTNERTVNLSEDARNYMRAQQISIKSDILKACAVRPKAMQTYWSRWGAVRPITEICLDQLIIKDGFIDGAAKIFLRVYDETIAFAGLTDTDKIDGLEDVGESDMSEGETMQTAASQAEPAATKLNFSQVVKPFLNHKQDTFSLDEGQVVLQWPAHLSVDSFEDFESWIELQMRKIKRSVQPRD